MNLPFTTHSEAAFYYETMPNMPVLNALISAHDKHFLLMLQVIELSVLTAKFRIMQRQKNSLSNQSSD